MPYVITTIVAHTVLMVAHVIYVTCYHYDPEYYSSVWLQDRTWAVYTPCYHYDHTMHFTAFSVVPLIPTQYCTLQKSWRMENTRQLQSRDLQLIAEGPSRRSGPEEMKMLSQRRMPSHTSRLRIRSMRVGLCGLAKTISTLSTTRVLQKTLEWMLTRYAGCVHRPHQAGQMRNAMPSVLRHIWKVIRNWIRRYMLLHSKFAPGSRKFATNTSPGPETAVQVTKSLV